MKKKASEEAVLKTKKAAVPEKAAKPAKAAKPSKAVAPEKAAKKASEKAAAKAPKTARTEAPKAKKASAATEKKAPKSEAKKLASRTDKPVSAVASKKAEARGKTVSGSKGEGTGGAKNAEIIEKAAKPVAALTKNKKSVKEDKPAKSASKPKAEGPKAKTASAEKPAGAKASKGAPTKKAEVKARATKGGVTSELKTKKRVIEKKVAEPAAVAKDAPSVISSHMENIYGRHYIIETAQDLPEKYGKDRLTVLMRDPEWAYAFWEITDEKVGEVKKTMGAEDFSDSKRVIRVYDLDESGRPKGSYRDVEISDTASSWYINVKPDVKYSFEFGYMSPEGDFVVTARSNSVETPPHSISSETDEKWMVNDGDFKRMFELSGGSKVGMSSADIMQVMARGMKPEELSALASRGESSDVAKPPMPGGISSEALSSQVLAEMGRSYEAEKKQRKFWMVVNTELIVYGATEPDAKVTFMGQPIKLRPDGTFSVRMALPDTDIDIPVKGISADDIDEITITPCVHKHTEYDKKQHAPKELSR